MKKIILLLMLLSSITVMGQEIYDSLVKEGKVWTLCSYMPYIDGDIILSHTDYCLGEDTEIDGVVYKRLYEKRYRNDEEKALDYQPTQYYYTESEGKVYCYDMEKQKTNVVLNFTLQKGDTFMLDDHYKQIVTNVSDTILSSSEDKMTRRCLYLYGENFPIQSDIWIEGIGSVNYGLSLIQRIGIEGVFSSLVHCTHDDVVIYNHDLDLGVEDIISPKLSNGIFDLQGRRLTEEPEKGIFIDNGVKRVK